MHRPEAAVWFYISIHALRKESDLAELLKEAEETRFQSTLSVRRATESWPAQAVRV